MKTTIDRDAYFTPDNVALACTLDFFKELPRYSNHIIVEPSAGGGAFCRAFETLNKDYKAFDLHPMANGITQQDFLADFTPLPPNSVVIGNPPYGKDSFLVKQFIKRGFMRGARAVGFLLFSGSAAISFLKAVNREVLYFKYLDKVDFIDNDNNVLLETELKQSSLIPIFIVFGRKRLQKSVEYFTSGSYSDFDSYFDAGFIGFDKSLVVEHYDSRTRGFNQDKKLIELVKSKEFILDERVNEVLDNLKFTSSFSLRISVGTFNYHATNNVYKGILNV